MDPISSPAWNTLAKTGASPPGLISDSDYKETRLRLLLQRDGLEANQALMRELKEKLELTTHDKVAAETRALEIEKEETRADKNRQEEAYISQVSGAFGTHFLMFEPVSFEDCTLDSSCVYCSTNEACERAWTQNSNLCLLFQA